MSYTNFWLSHLLSTFTSSFPSFHFPVGFSHLYIHFSQPEDDHCAPSSSGPETQKGSRSSADFWLSLKTCMKALMMRQVFLFWQLGSESSRSEGTSSLCKPCSFFCFIFPFCLLFRSLTPRHRRVSWRPVKRWNYPTTKRASSAQLVPSFSFSSSFTCKASRLFLFLSILLISLFPFLHFPNDATHSRTEPGGFSFLAT